MKKTLISLTLAFGLFLILFSCSKNFDQKNPGAVTGTTDASSVFTCSGAMKNGLAIRDAGYILNNYSQYSPTLATTNFVIIQVYWNTVDTSAATNAAGTFNFTELDNYLSQINTLNTNNGFGIKVKLRLYGGLNAPAWVRNNTAYGGGTDGIPYIDYADIDNDGSTTDTVTLPRPWSTGYLGVYRKFLVGLKAHCAASSYSSLIVDVTGAAMSVATAEPMFLKLGGTGNVTGADTITARGWLLAGYSATQHTNSIKYSFDLFDSVWSPMGLSMSMCFSRLQVLKKRVNGTYFIEESLDSAKHLVDYYYTKNGCRSVLGNNGLRYNVACADSGSTKPADLDTALYSYLVQTKYPNGTGQDPVCRIYYQTMQSTDGLMGHLYKTLAKGLSYKADYIELPSYAGLPDACDCVSGCPIRTSTGFADSLDYYDTLLGD